MEEQALQSGFDPAQRAPLDKLRASAITLRDQGLITPVLDEIPNIIAILNRHRQIVYANRTARSAMMAHTEDEWLGRRPGEAFQCIHATETPEGCGSSADCPLCGGATAAAAAEIGSGGVFDCHVVRRSQLDAIDFRIFSSSLPTDGDRFTLIVAVDVSHEMRRHALERIFFHDLLNATGNIEGLAYLLGHAKSPDEGSHLEDMLKRSCERMADEIRTQRDIFEAEGGGLQLDLDSCVAADLARDLVERYRYHPVARDKRIVIRDPCKPLPMIRTDPPLLGRVVGNLVKNALEATQSGGTVIVEVAPADDRFAVQFLVWNEHIIPEESRARLFSRSFSTKGHGRGLGAYGAKLIAERYLGGTITFTSRPGDGTTFRVALPAEPPAATCAD